MGVTYSTSLSLVLVKEPMCEKNQLFGFGSSMILAIYCKSFIVKLDWDLAFKL